MGTYKSGHGLSEPFDLLPFLNSDEFVLWM